MIDKFLNNYKRNIASIEMLKIKINQWQDTLTKDSEEINRIYSKPRPENLGISKTNVSNPIETMVIRAEEQKEKIKSWIKDAEEKIQVMETDNKIVDILLKTLDEESAFIITQKHFEKKKWNIITYQFNSKYRNEYNEYITSAGVRKKYETTKKQLSDLFGEISKTC